MVRCWPIYRRRQRSRLETEKQKLAPSLRRRTLILGGVKGTLMTMLAFRLYQLQVLDSERYWTLSEENRIDILPISPRRGCIVDRSGQIIACNRHIFRLIFIPDQTDSLRDLLARLTRLLPIRDDVRYRVLERYDRGAREPMTLRKSLSWEEASRVEVNAHDLPGARIELGERRYYPEDNLVAHVVGYVALPSASDFRGILDNALLKLPGFRVGREGIERFYESKMRGRAGTREVEVNAFGNIIRERGRRGSTDGENIRLSIDLNLQRLARQALSVHQAGSVILLDINDGSVLALVSWPDFDPNLFAEALSRSTWQQVATNLLAPMSNRVIAGLYHPGSLFKMTVALAALEAGVDPRESVFCQGRVELGNEVFHCWLRGGHGSIDLDSAIARSCDVYFYNLARHLGVERIAATALKLGFGQPAGIDLPGEASGLVPTPQWKQDNLGERWLEGETLHLSIGQGYLLTTPLQLATTTACLVNGGRFVTPHLLVDSSSPQESQKEAIGFSNTALTIIKKGMRDAIADPLGTVHSLLDKAPAEVHLIGGKTGTAQVRRISERERAEGVIDNEQLPWNRRDHALFVGYAPRENPRYIAAVVVDHGGSGSRIAAPIARDLLVHCLRHPPYSISVRSSA